MTELTTTRRGSMSPMRRLRIWEAAGGVCCVCNLKIDGVREKWGIEHKRPLALGGTDTDDNCGPAHLRCMALKTKADNKQWTKAKRQKAKIMLGIKPRSSRAMDGTRRSGIRKRMDGTVEKWT